MILRSRSNGPRASACGHFGDCADGRCPSGSLPHVHSSIVRRSSSTNSAFFLCGETSDSLAPACLSACVFGDSLIPTQRELGTFNNKTLQLTHLALATTPHHMTPLPSVTSYARKNPSTNKRHVKKKDTWTCEVGIEDIMSERVSNTR